MVEELEQTARANEERVQRLARFGRRPDPLDLVAARLEALAMVVGALGSPLLELAFQQNLGMLLEAMESELTERKLVMPDGTPVPQSPLPFDGGDVG